MCEFGVLDVFDCTPTEPHGLTTLLYRRQPPLGSLRSARYASPLSVTPEGAPSRTSRSSNLQKDFYTPKTFADFFLLLAHPVSLFVLHRSVNGKLSILRYENNDPIANRCCWTDWQCFCPTFNLGYPRNRRRPVHDQCHNDRGSG